RPRALDWDAPDPPQRTLVELKLGFPEMRLSNALIDRLRSPGLSAESHLQAQCDLVDRLKPGLQQDDALAHLLESRLQADADLPDRLKPGLRPVGPHTTQAEIAQALLS